MLSRYKFRPAFLPLVQAQLADKYKKSGDFGVVFPAETGPHYNMLDVWAYEHNIPRICVNYISNPFSLSKKYTREWGGIERTQLDYTLELSCTVEELVPLSRWILSWIRFNENGCRAAFPTPPVAMDKPMRDGERYCWTEAGEALYYRNHPHVREE